MIAQSARTGCADGRVRRSSARQKKPARRSSVRRSRRGGVPKRRKGRLLGTLRANGAVAFAQGQTSVSVFSRRWARVVHGREWPEVERSGMQGGHPRRPDPHPSPTTPSGSRRRRFARHGRRSRQILQHIVERDRLRARADPARRQHRGQAEHRIADHYEGRRARANDDTGPDFGDRHAALAQNGPGLAARGEMGRGVTHRLRVAAADDAFQRGGQAVPQERMACTASTVSGHPRAASASRRRAAARTVEPRASKYGTRLVPTQPLAPEPDTDMNCRRLIHVKRPPRQCR